MGKIKATAIIVCGLTVGWFLMEGVAKLRANETDASISFTVASIALLFGVVIIGESYRRRRR